MDKKATQVGRERAKSASTVTRAPAGKKQPRSTATRGSGSAPLRKQPTPAGPVDFTHVDKVWFPDKGITKGDVLHYYLSVADKLLPHLRDRPITLERMPDGVGEGKPRFWQKNTPAYYPSWIPRINLPTDEGKAVNYALVNDERTLAYLVNQGTITFHPFLSRVQDLDRPDFVLFDLDPGEAKFADVVRIARTLHDLLDGQNLANFVKTSGKSGLHVLVPWPGAGGFDEARGWAMGIAKAVVRELPDLATVERFKSEREGRVYVDVIQNGPHKHAVPPYVARPTPGATVSTPLDWKEVTAKLDPKRFDVRTAVKRFGSRDDLLAALAKPAGRQPRGILSSGKRSR
jgi:bifunctional non-homologous end joining protein LigD